MNVTITPRSTRRAVAIGLVWGVVFAVVLPLAVAVLAWLGGAADGVQSHGGGGSGRRGTRPARRRLQYLVTTGTVVVLYGLAGVGFAVRARGRL